MGIDEVAIFGAALSPEQVDAHWSAGQADLGVGPCAAAPTAPYAKAILADSPTVYYRLNDASVGSQDGLALDFSSHCDNAAYEGHPTPATGALAGDPDPGTGAGGRNTVLIQSDDLLPAGNAARTFETWVDYGCCNGAFTLFQYGDVAGGHGFSVSIGDSGGSISVTAGGSPPVSASTVSDFAHGWHMVDVTYDGSTVEIYQDGQVIGGGTVGAAATVVPGQGLELNANTAGMGLDEMAVYPTALSSQKVNAHWEAQYLTPPGESLIAGTASIGGGGAAQGARVQACPTSGSACQVDASPVDSSGAFHMLVPNDTYIVTIFPPSGSSSGPDTLGPITVPPNALNLNAVFAPPGGLPTGATFSSPSTGTQQNVVPRVNWGEPSTLSVTGCKGGFGIVYFQATNTSTGQSETHSALLVETPSGSGTYIAQIPPLAPLHGLGTLDPQITCPGTTNVLPDGGPLGGGTSVFLTGSGFTGATAVRFGSTPASSFEVQTGGLIIAVAPPGSGTVAVSVTSSQGVTLNVGNYTYFDVTGLDTGSGPAAGGNTVTITGHGFNDVRGVVFGLMPSPSVTVVSSTEIQAVAPVGIGTVDVQVINGLAVSRPSQAVLYMFTGGPPGSSNISEGTTQGDAAPSNLANQISTFCANGNCPPQINQGAQEWMNPPPTPDGQGSGISPDDRIAFGDLDIGGALIFACLTNPAATVGCAVAGAGVALGELAFQLLWNHHICVLGLLGNCNVYIDPSGTVIDRIRQPDQRRNRDAARTTLRWRRVHRRRPIERRDRTRHEPGDDRLVRGVRLGCACGHV